MNKRLFNLAAVMSLILCISVVVIWVRSLMSENILLESRDGQFLLVGIGEASPKAVREFRDAQTLEQFLSELRSPPLTINDVAIPRPQESHFLGFTWVRGTFGKVYVPGTDGNN